MTTFIDFQETEFRKQYLLQHNFENSSIGVTEKLIYDFMAYTRLPIFLLHCSQYTYEYSC